MEFHVAQILREPVGYRRDFRVSEPVDVVTGARLPAPEEPTPFLIDEHHILNLCEALRQQLVIAEPMQPLCKEECAGLCQVCGQDKNGGSCACASGELDSRWAALGDFPRASS